MVRTDYFNGLFDDLPPAPVTHVTHRQTDCVTTNAETVTRKNSDLADPLPTLRTLRTKPDEAEHKEAIAEHLAERAAIMEYAAGLPREQAEAEARRITHAYRYRLHGDEGGGIYITSSNLQAARAALLKRYGSRLAVVVRA